MNRTIHQFFPSCPSIDHFLGKYLFRICSISVLRTPFWNPSGTATTLREYANNPGGVGVEGRGRFYEEVGAIRDVVQNHLLQILVLLVMDAPISSDPETMRDEKFRLRQKSIKTLMRRGANFVVISMKNVLNSQVETLAAVRLHMHTWRWAGVPFYIRAWKRLPVTTTEVLVELKRPPQVVFHDATPGP